MNFKGKINVAGNSRTRTMMYKFGKTGNSSTNLRLDYSFQLINTFTGSIGFQI